MTSKTTNRSLLLGVGKSLGSHRSATHPDQAEPSVQTAELHQRTEHQWLQRLVAAPIACLPLNGAEPYWARQPIATSGQLPRAPLRTAAEHLAFQWLLRHKTLFNNRSQEQIPS